MGPVVAVGGFVAPLAEALGLPVGSPLVGRDEELLHTTLALHGSGFRFNISGDTDLDVKASGVAGLNR